MPRNVPDELVVAKLSIEAASVALGALFDKMETHARSEKIIISQPVHEAMARLKAAQALLAELEARLDDESR
jgi:hypothetical protein